MYRFIPKVKEKIYMKDKLKISNELLIKGDNLKLLSRVKKIFKKNMDINILYEKKSNMKNKIVVSKKQFNPNLILNENDKQAYSLLINENGIIVEGNSVEAVNYGITTLELITEQEKTKYINGLKIIDKPKIKKRGLQLDISRGKIFKFNTLKNIIDILSKFKMNVFQLYIENTFDFSKHNFCDKDNTIKREFIKKIQDYCEERYIDFIPNIQSFGHARRILNKKEYRYLSESNLYWTLSPAEKDSYKLIDDMYEEFLPLFKNKYVNVGCDETYDLGKGKTKEIANKIGKEKIYLNHIFKLHELAKKYDKKIMIYDDVLLKNHKIINELPNDIILLDWNYDPQEVYETPKILNEYNNEYWICPGTGSWNSLFPRLEGAKKNIINLISDGIKYNTKGMLLTDWGDHGHYNFITPNYYSYILAANMSWGNEDFKIDEFEKKLGKLFYKDNKWLNIINLFSEIYKLPGMWSKNRSQCVISLFEEPLTGDTIIGKEPPTDLKPHKKLPAGVNYVMDEKGHHPLRPVFRFTDETINKLEKIVSKIDKKLNEIEDSFMKKEFTYLKDAYTLIITKHRLGKNIRKNFLNKKIDTEKILDYNVEIRKIKKEYTILMLKYIEIWNKEAQESEIYKSLTYFSNIISRFDYLQDWLWKQRKLIENNDKPDYDLETYETCEYKSLPTY